MADEKWQKVREIFDSALRRQPEERRRYVNEACGDDKTLLFEVESLLSSLGSAESFMETPAVAKVADIIEAETKKLEKGSCFGHYEIIEQIGTGGMGEVYLAKDKKLDRKVAVKILNEKISREESNLNRFIQEAKAASALNHPNILVIHEIGSSDEAHYIVSEFIKGKTLRERLKQSSLKLSEILDISIQIASALAAAHEAHITHRDIKPENIMIRPDGFVKLLDFGLAKLVEQKNKSFIGLEESTVKQNQTAKGVILGTINYMSPEQARSKDVDARTDIWGLGVVLYEMLTGKTPFAGETTSDTIGAILNKNPAPLAASVHDIAKEFERIVGKALRKNREERYQHIKDLLIDLKDFKKELEVNEILERSTATSTNNEATNNGAVSITAQTGQTTSSAEYIFGEIKQYKGGVLAVLAVLLVSSISLGYWFFSNRKASTNSNQIKSIAVLPLKPINAASRDEIYEIGIAESLIQQLGSVKGFAVRPLSAIRKYADIEQDPLAAGREQQADYVLASNYQIAGGKIRITSQLLNVTNGQIEETYKSVKDTSDVFALQDAISEDVGKLFQTHFAVAAATNTTAKRGTDNEEAYRLYLQAMYLVDKENPADSRRAIELFDEALALDPNYAKAWANKARAYCHYAHTSGNSPDAAFAKAKPALEKAFALDNNLADARAVLGIITTDYDWDFAEGEKQFRQAIELSPNTDIFYRWFASRLSGQGRYDEAIAMAKTAIDLNPNYIFPQIIYGRILYGARRYDDSIRQMERVIERDSANPLAYNTIWRCFHKKGDYQRAYEAFMKAQRLSGTKDDVLKNYETLYAKSGWQSVLLRFLEIIKTNDANGSDAYTIAMLSALTGDREQSLSYLNKAFKNRSLAFLNIVGDPGFDPLRGDPRFAELVRRVESK